MWITFILIECEKHRCARARRVSRSARTERNPQMSRSCLARSRVIAPRVLRQSNLCIFIYTAPCTYIFVFISNSLLALEGWMRKGRKGLVTRRADSVAFKKSRYSTSWISNPATYWSLPVLYDSHRKQLRGFTEEIYPTQLGPARTLLKH